MKPSTIAHPLTPEHFRAVAVYLNNGIEHGALTRASRELGLSYQGVSNYATGRRPVPANVVMSLRLLVRLKNLETSLLG